MNKILKYITLCLFIAGMSSCAKEEIGGTAVQDMCGEWYVDVDYVDANGAVLGSYGSGYSIYTYNTNANLSTEMYIEDTSFFGFRVMVNVDYANMTFSGNDLEDDYYGNVVSIHDGKIGIKDATSYAGYKADSISFIVEDSGVDEDGEPYTDYYWYHGYRRTGLNGGYD